MNIKYTFMVIFSIAILLCTSCSEEERNHPLMSTTIRGSGVMETQSRTVSDFDEVVLSAAGEVNISFGSPQTVSVTVDKNIMSYVETVLTGSRLDIRIKNGVNAMDYYLVVNIVVPQLKNLELRGAGSITGQNLLRTDDINLTLTGVGSIDLYTEASIVNTLFTGPGTVTLRGTTDNHICTMSSMGTLRAFDLATGVTAMTLSGSGNAEVNVSDTLRANLSGLGSVYYQGNPTIIDVRTGLGRVIDAN